MKKIIIITALFVMAGWLMPMQNAYAEFPLLGEPTGGLTPPSESELLEGEVEFKSDFLEKGKQYEKTGLKDYEFDLSKTLQTTDQKQSWLWDSESKENDAEEKSPLIALLMKIISIMTYTIGSAALLVLILSGLWLVTSHGESSQIEKGKKILTYAMVGLGFSFASYIIITFVQSLLT